MTLLSPSLPDPPPQPAGHVPTGSFWPVHLFSSGTRCRAWHSKGSEYVTDLDFVVELLPCSFLGDMLHAAAELQVPPSEEASRCLDVLLTATEPRPFELFLRSLSGCNEHVFVILPNARLFSQELSKELLKQGCFVKVRWFGTHCCVA